MNQPDNETVTLLHWAAINNRQDIIRYYVSKGAIVDAVGGDLLATPLHWASRFVCFFLFSVVSNKYFA